MAKILAGLLIAVLLISIGAAANSPPGTPTVPIGPMSGVVGTSYSYSTSSNDPNGDQVKYTFYWGDGSASYVKLSPSGATVSASHIWKANGAYNVYVKAIDSKYAASPLSSITQVTIGQVVANRPPVTPSIPSGPTSGTSGTSYAYSTSATDPDGNKVKYTFSWGDGTTTTAGPIDSGISATGSHAWTVASGTSKTFSVTVIATDSNGLSSGLSNTLSVTIAGPAAANHPPATPSIPDGELIPLSGQTYSYSTKATDPDGDQVKYTFDWGDGTTSTTSMVNSGVSAKASHTWTVAPGTRKDVNVRAKATDTHGTASSWSNPLPTIVMALRENHPPTIPTKPVGNMQINSAGQGVGVSGVVYSFSTVSTDSDGDTIKYIFDWGDGSTETGYFSSGQVVTASHSWNVPAGKTYPRTVQVLSADYRDMMSPYPYWSAPLVVAITG